MCIFGVMLRFLEEPERKRVGSVGRNEWAGRGAPVAVCGYTGFLAHISIVRSNV